MKQTKKLIRMLALGAFALGEVDVARAADANPPERMTYQGYLVDVNGDPLGKLAPTNYDTVFRVYAAKQGGTALWAEQQTITVDKGYFSVLLGEGSQYGSELHGDLSGAFDGTDVSDRFIGITVDVGGVGIRRGNQAQPRRNLGITAACVHGYADETIRGIQPVERGGEVAPGLIAGR